MKVSGTEIPNHRAKIATKVPKGIAAEEPSTQRIRFIRKKSANTMLRRRKGQKDNDGEKMLSLCCNISQQHSKGYVEKTDKKTIVVNIPWTQQCREQNVGLPLFTSES